ncbi:MAG TPA: hypothetical protein VIM96_03290 [Pseudomonadales bacterium]
MTANTLPKAARLAADSGNTVDAIKITREETGCDLLTAKTAVDAYLAGSPHAAHAQQTASTAMPPEAIAPLEAGRLIDAIKITRTATGLGLKASKEAVELYLANNPGVQERFRQACHQSRNAALQKLLNALLLMGIIAAVLMWAGLLKWPS